MACEVSLMESQLACLSTAASGALNALPGTPAPGRRGTAHENIAPYQAFQCKDGEYFVIGERANVAMPNLLFLMITSFLASITNY